MKCTFRMPAGSVTMATTSAMVRGGGAQAPPAKPLQRNQVYAIVAGVDEHLITDPTECSDGLVF